MPGYANNSEDQAPVENSFCIALNALHDKAFDRGLITFDTNLRLVCSKALKGHFAHATIAQHFQAYEGQPLSLQLEAAGPKPEFLEWPRNEHGFMS